MRTLRDVMWSSAGDKKAFVDAVVKPTKALIEATLKEYGSYRVVEGVLEEAHWYRGRHVGRLVVVRVEDGDPQYVNLGTIGDYVKLILPPEEKGVTDVTADMLRVSRAQTDASRAREASERARADRYEKALREIRDLPTTPGHLLAQARATAREALDE